MGKWERLPVWLGLVGLVLGLAAAALLVMGFPLCVRREGSAVRNCSWGADRRLTLAGKILWAEGRGVAKKKNRPRPSNFTGNMTNMTMTSGKRELPSPPLLALVATSLGSAAVVLTVTSLVLSLAKQRAAARAREAQLGLLFIRLVAVAAGGAAALVAGQSGVLFMGPFVKATFYVLAWTLSGALLETWLALLVVEALLFFHPSFSGDRQAVRVESTTEGDYHRMSFGVAKERDRPWPSNFTGNMTSASAKAVAGSGPVTPTVDGPPPDDGGYENIDAVRSKGQPDPSLPPTAKDTAKERDIDPTARSSNRPGSSAHKLRKPRVVSSKKKEKAGGEGSEHEYADPFDQLADKGADSPPSGGHSGGHSGSNSPVHRPAGTEDTGGDHSGHDHSGHDDHTGPRELTAKAPTAAQETPQPQAPTEPPPIKNYHWSTYQPPPKSPNKFPTKAPTKAPSKASAKYAAVRAPVLDTQKNSRSAHTPGLNFDVTEAKSGTGREPSAANKDDDPFADPGPQPPTIAAPYQKPLYLG